MRDQASWDKSSVKWWLEEDPADSLWSTLKRIRDRQSWRLRSDDLSLRLYADCKYVGYRSNDGTYESEDILQSRQGENVIRAIVRTLHSKVCRHRPRPVILTDGASWTEKHRAELLDIWVNGKLAEIRADWDIFPMAILQALILGTGIVRSYGDPEKGAWLEVIPAYEVFVDDGDARYGTPRSIYFVRVVDRDVLAATFPDAEEIILKADPASAQKEWGDALGRWDDDLDNNRILCVEAIHLPSSKNSDDGDRTMAVQGGVIFREKWKRDHFPCAFIHGERRPMGFWGIGIGEDLAGAQLEHNRTIASRQEMIRLLSVPFWLVERGSKVVKSHISNLIGRIVEYSGNKPELVTPQAVPAELWRHAETVKKGMFEARGVSQLTAQAIKPAGLNSGRALRTYTDLESELLVDLIRSYERLVLDCAHLLIEEQEELGKEYADQAVTVIGRGKIDRISWKDANMPSDSFRIQIVPASSLSATVSGRIEDIFDLRDLGAITDPEEIRDLLDLPDLKRHKRKSMAHRELLEMVIEKKILGEGIWVQPEPFWDLELAMKLGLQNLLEAQLYEDAPSDRLELLAEWTAMCEKMIRDPYGTTEANTGQLPPPEAVPPALPPGPEAMAPGGALMPPEALPGMPPQPLPTDVLAGTGAPPVAPAGPPTLPPNPTGLG